MDGFVFSAASLGLLKYGAAQTRVDKFKFNEWKPYVEGGGMAIYERVLAAVGEDKKFEEYLCDKYGVRAAFPFWSDKTLPDCGVPKGTSYIIGSFREEKDVPRDLLAEISDKIGSRMTYSGRYVDTGITCETKFIFCYAVCPSVDEQNEEVEIVPTHISDLL